MASEMQMREEFYNLAQAFRDGFNVAEVHEFSKIDPWFLEQIYEIVKFEDKIDMDILNNRRATSRGQKYGLFRQDDSCAYQ